LTYRMAGHSTSDDPRRYRAEAELDMWGKRDPIERMRAFLDTQGWADPGWLHELDAEADQLATDTRAACLTLPEPGLETTFRNTLCEESDALRAEREWFTSYQESFL